MYSNQRSVEENKHSWNSIISTLFSTVPKIRRGWNSIKIVVFLRNLCLSGTVGTVFFNILLFLRADIFFCYLIGKKYICYIYRLFSLVKNPGVLFHLGTNYEGTVPQKSTVPYCSNCSILRVATQEQYRKNTALRLKNTKIMVALREKEPELFSQSLDTPSPKGRGFSGYGARRLRAVTQPKVQSYKYFRRLFSKCQVVL